jgi:hypothetical protein
VNNQFFHAQPSLSITVFNPGIRTALTRRPPVPELADGTSSVYIPRSIGTESAHIRAVRFRPFGTPPSEVQPLGNAGPPLIDRPSPLPMRINRLMFGLDGYSAAPTATDLEQIKVLSGLMTTAGEQVRRLVSEDLANLNKTMRDAGIPYINADTGEAGGGMCRRED